MATAVAAASRPTGACNDAASAAAVTAVSTTSGLRAAAEKEHLVQRWARDKKAHGAGRAVRGEFRLNAPGIAPLHKIVPTPSTADTCAGSGVGGQLPPAAGAAALNAPHQPAVRAPYLKALLTPAKPRQTPTRRPTPVVSTTGCFRCLASDHLVRDCRDPVRCRNCRGCGHRFSSCPMPVAHVLTPLPRRHPTVPISASRGTVTTEPFSPRYTTAPLPPTPASDLHPPVAFDPINFIASSSTEAPNLELNAERAAPLSALAAGATYLRRERTLGSPSFRDIHVPALLFHVAASLAAVRITAAAPPTTSALPPTPPPADASPAITSPLAPVPCTFPTPEPAGDLPPNPPPSPVAARAPGVRLGRRARVSSCKPKRTSSRLAAKAAASYVSIPDMAMQRAALKNSLQPCSAALKEHVEKKGILNRSKIPIPVADLRKLVSAAGLGCAAASAVGAVPRTAK
ncbi:calphotin-like [Panicum virgatum]|uniref:calphotin-like n=1 Tax=Panicum virgatum TaxID=38727 RepID=UPI0019D625BA|nr:calphotin-like [Panicum virgatum]